MNYSRIHPISLRTRNIYIYIYIQTTCKQHEVLHRCTTKAAIKTKTIPIFVLCSFGFVRFCAHRNASFGITVLRYQVHSKCNLKWCWETRFFFCLCFSSPFTGLCGCGCEYGKVRDKERDIFCLRQ